MPYCEKRFVGYEAEKKELDPEVLEKYIFNGHVGEYMEEMEEESPDKFSAHFAKYHAAEVTYDTMEDIYKEVSCFYTRSIHFSQFCLISYSKGMS
jgi:large subunit ribosomal protein L5e